MQMHNPAVPAGPPSSVDVTDDVDSVMPHIDKLANPIFVKLGDTFEKIHTRSRLLAEATAAYADNRPAAGVVPMRIPQLPADAVDEFKAQFETVAANASKEFTRLIIEVRNKDLSTLREQEVGLISQLSDLVDKSMAHLQQFSGAQLDDTRCNLIKHACRKALHTRVVALRRKLHTKAAFASFAAKEKSAMDASDAVNETADAAMNDAEALVALRKELAQVKKDLSKLKHSPPPRGNPSGKATVKVSEGRGSSNKSSAPGQRKDKGKPSASAEGKSKSKPKGNPPKSGKGQRGAGRGAKHQ